MFFYIPWKAKVAAYLIYQRFISILSQLTKRRKNGAEISFYCNYQQTTGSTVAIACIANQLSGPHNVDAYIKPLMRVHPVAGLARATDFFTRKSIRQSGIRRY